MLDARCLGKLEEPLLSWLVRVGIGSRDRDERRNGAPDLVREHGETARVARSSGPLRDPLDRPGRRLGEHRVVARHPCLGERAGRPRCPRCRAR